jgi:hypothetical protein
LGTTLAFGPQVQLQWTDNSTVEAGFTIERCTGVGCTNFVGIDGVGVDVTGYTDAIVMPNTTYGYRVLAYNAAGNSIASNVATIAVPPSPAAPTNLVLTVRGALPPTGPRIIVGFRDNQNGNAAIETGFQIFRSENGGAFSLLTTLGPRAGVGNVTYNDYNVLGGSTYGYYVMTVNAGSASLPSNTALTSLPPAPAAPSNFTATTQVAGGGTTARVNMIWTDNANNETRFVIQRATDANFTTNVVNLIGRANITTFVNSGLPRGTTFYYRITAQNLYGQSVWVLLTPFPIITP